ncbi:hypothetical protein DL764_003022 [Monosporascus ibericus]|uniref:Uncharacterized protein n=1 Tax=Monosporascus ibericus TaxID=155417 RepID=A0A4Q4TI71_9PEZI|nr:hypothetical protein DL764_003022 [Monosporascus ibericus]
MSSSQNNNNNLMGFSVHQPSVGAALQFFPPMGSKELDQMIDAYVPGNASILDKRTVVTCEFVQHSIATGELFKFFLVYPSSVPNSLDSPASLQDSGYSSFNTSPVMPEGQWANTASPSTSKPRSPSKKATASDFSHMPGMKIMTKDGVDVTNSASRGCKTKEQRDHAHLMRIIKACESCRKKKVRCDPSHKKRSSSQSQPPEPKSHKKVKKASIAAKVANPQMCVSDHTAVFPSASFAGSRYPPEETSDSPEWMSSFDSFVPTDEIDIFSEMENWDQFINYGDDSTAVQQDYNFNVDHFSPTTSSTNSTSPSQPFTPATRGLSWDGFEFTPAGDFTFDNGVAYAGAFASGEVAPTLPYLNPGGIEGGTNYLDFNLYSPGSTSDEDLGFSRDIAAASPQQESFDHLGGHQNDGSYERVSDHRHKSELNDRLPNAGQSTESIRQSSVAGDHQASLFSGQETIPAPGSSHDKSRSSLQSAADATRCTGLARVDNQQVPAGNNPQPPLIPPRDPNVPPGLRREAAIDSGYMHRASAEESQATQSSRSRTKFQVILQASATSSRTPLMPDNLKTMSGESSLSSAVNVRHDSTHARERHVSSVGLRSNSLQTSTAQPEQGNLVSSLRSTSGRCSTGTVSHSTSADAASLSPVAGTYSTRSSAKQGGLRETNIAASTISIAEKMGLEDTDLTSAMCLYESKQRSPLRGEGTPSILHQPDRVEIAVFVCLTALALFSKSAVSLTVGTLFVISAFVGLWRQTSPCADKLGLSAQRLSFAGQFTVGQKPIFAVICLERPTSWTRPTAYGSGTYLLGCQKVRQ